MSGTALIVVTHLLGSGHLVRAAHLARALARGGFAVTLASGGMKLRPMEGEPFAFAQLPAVRTEGVDFRTLLDEAGRAVEPERMAARTAALQELATRLRPDVVVTEHFPFGRRQVRFELLPLLDAIARAEPKPKLLTSLRDILQERSKPGRDEETVTLINGHFDHVLVHGDPSFIRIEDTFPLANEIAGKVIYTGLVAAPPPAPCGASDRIRRFRTRSYAETAHSSGTHSWSAGAPAADA